MGGANTASLRAYEFWQLAAKEFLQNADSAKTAPFLSRSQDEGSRVDEATRGGETQHPCRTSDLKRLHR